ncbi:hypothetical protein ACJX0J_014362, partial [Zea mays]
FRVFNSLLEYSRLQLGTFETCIENKLITGHTLVALSERNGLAFLLYGVCSSGISHSILLIEAHTEKRETRETRYYMYLPHVLLLEYLIFPFLLDSYSLEDYLDIETL